MKIIAFYLPQFHTIPENDEWWGEGFTEWVNVINAKPQFEKHLQPKVPLNKNYYNLLDDSVKEWQIKLAKANGVYGFCFYHYWFGGKLMLEKPIEQYLNNKTLDFPYCLCWADPPWTRVWAGEGSKVLIDQDYGNEELWKKHFDYLLPFFKDERYIKEDGKPLMVMYTPSRCENINEMVDYIRKRAVEEGFKGISLAYQYYVSEEEDKKLRRIFDHCIKFQPVYALHSIEDKGNVGAMKMGLKKINAKIKEKLNVSLTDHFMKLRISNYDTVWEAILSAKVEPKDIAGAFVGWDNTPRRGKSGRVIVDSSPEKFEEYLKRLKQKVITEYDSDFVFLTAWNEWSEGSYLEPDEENKDGYLMAIKHTIEGKDDTQY